MSQKRMGKGLSLGQTINQLRVLARPASVGEFYGAAYISMVAKGVLYHISALQKQLRSLNNKIKKEKQV